MTPQEIRQLTVDFGNKIDNVPLSIQAQASAIVGLYFLFGEFVAQLAEFNLMVKELVNEGKVNE
jgi:hypothetical protein